MTYCPRCDMENCEHTTGAGRRYDASVRPTARSFSGQDGPTITANLSGRCAGCGHSYDDGELIKMNADAGGWCRVECCG